MSCTLCDPNKKSMTSLVILEGLLLLYILIWTGSAFNLDARYPKIFTHTTNSYFGYSVAFWNEPSGYKVLVGSPKAKSGTLIVGGVFQCDIKTELCRLFDVENDARSDGSRSNQWLGVSMDVSPINQNLITVCAHLAKYNVTHDKTEKKMANGICYEMENQKLKQIIKLQPNQNLLGISVRYAKRSNILLIGIPGRTLFHGGYYEQMFYMSNTESLNYGPYSYAGYCVTVLNNKSTIGIPRYRHYGAVWYQYQIITVMSKYSFGSYFGSSLASVDLNSDTKEDLVVGAPYYSEQNVEEGRVYIYFFSNNRLNDTADIILSVSSYRGQFGKTLATGDFNNDGYSDVIVSAPYENEGSGTVYLFSGHRFGLHEKFSQKIQGKDFRQNIQSFGISFSRTVDIDSNGFQDIAVGAYLSDKVFIFYGRPIMEVKGSLKAKPRIISSCTDCWQSNKHVFTVLQVEINLSKMDPMIFIIDLNMDANRNMATKRTYLENDQKKFTDTVKITQFFKKDFRVIIKNTVDILEPINFTLTYYLKDQGYSPSCSSTCPIARNGSFSTQVKFDIGCGVDDTCDTSLKVTIKYSSHQLILGKDQKFVLLAKVENLGENAYSAKARIFYSQFLEFESVNQTSHSNVQCNQENDQELSCFLGHPLKENNNVYFEVIFFIARMPKENAIQIIMNATTISKVADEHVNNTQILLVPLYFESKLEVTGLSFPESDVFKSSTSKMMSVMHQYELRNNGPSDALAVKFFVLIPHAIFQEVPLLIFRKVQMKTEVGKLINNSCHMKPYTETKEDFKATLQHLRHNGYVFNCTGFKCHNISCELEQLQKNGPVIHIQIYFDININLLKYFQDRIRSIAIVTNSTLTQLPSFRLIALHSDHSQTKTTILINRRPVKLKWWVVICSIAAGLLILLIFSILLWHCGYFKRMRVNKMQQQEERAKEERSLLEYDSGRRPSQKIYTREKISESEEIPEID